MNKKLNEYIEIEFGGFLKKKRNQLHKFFLSEINTNELSIEDILFLLKEIEEKDLVIRKPFFSKIIYPVLERGIKKNNLETIKWVVKLKREYNRFRLGTEIEKPSERELIRQGLQINPNDEDLLKLHASSLHTYLSFTIHEVDFGYDVLYDFFHNVETEVQCDELIELLEEYKGVCNRLSLNRDWITNECEFHFSHYKNYLKNTHEFDSYKDFLEKNKKESK